MILSSADIPKVSTVLRKGHLYPADEKYVPCTSGHTENA